MKKAILWGVAIVGFCATSLYGLQTGGRRFSDFAVYYTASRIFAAGDSVSFLYEDDWFKEKVHRYGIPDSTFIMYANPPVVALVMFPVSWMEPASAKIAWNVLSVILAILAIELLRRLLQIPAPSERVPILALIVTCSLPFLRNLQRGQIYVLMLVLLLLFVQGYAEKRPFLTALPLAAMMLLKYFGWIFLLLFVVERKWRELQITLTAAVIGFLLGVFLLGADTYMASFEVLRSSVSRADIAFTGLPCLLALWGGLFTFHAAWNPNPVVDLPWLASLLSMVSGLVMVALTLQKPPSPSTDLSPISSLVVLSVVFTPLAADHHYILLALPVSVFLFKSNVSFRGAHVFLLSMVLLLALLGWYPQPAMKALPGWVKVLAFPRLYAAIVLWYLLLTRMNGPAPRPK